MDQVNNNERRVQFRRPEVPYPVDPFRMGNRNEFAKFLTKRTGDRDSHFNHVKLTIQWIKNLERVDWQWRQTLTLLFGVMPSELSGSQMLESLEVIGKTWRHGEHIAEWLNTFPKED